jgi:tRNA(fMet)-specific endonuclease VapC
MADPAFLLDSSICMTLFEGGSPRAKAKVEACRPDEIAVSAIVLAEVMIGACRADRVAEIEAFFQNFPVLPFDEAAARTYARLPFKRGSYDRLIAAHALSLGLTLVTSNVRDFEKISDLKLEDWTVS